MLQIISAKKSIYLSAYLLLTPIFLTTLACSHNTSSNLRKESEEFESEIVSVRNPNIVIQTPVAFAWLPESIKAYDDTGLKDFPLQETIQGAITESLTRNDYEYNNSTYAIRTLIDREKNRTNIQPEDLILVKNWKWAGSNFGAGGFLKELTLDNRGIRDVKDLRIRIDYLGTMGVKEGTAGPTTIFVLHGLLPAKSEKTFKDISIGFRHPGARKESIRVLGVKTITHDLLVGYTFVLEDALNDQDINMTHDITAGPSGSNDRINEYKKGTVIIDIIDAVTKVLVWRGAVQALASFDIPEDTKLNRIRLAAEKLANNFIMSNQ